MAEKRRRGRPPLDPTSPSVKLNLVLPARQYDAVYRRAHQDRVSLPEVVRRALRGQLAPRPPRPDQS